MNSKANLQLQQWQEQCSAWMKEALHQILEELRPSPHPGEAAESETIGDYAVPPVLTVRRDESIASVREKIGTKVQISHIPICYKNGKYLGTIPIAVLLTADPDSPVESHMVRLPAVSADEGLNQATTIAMEAAASEIIVTDDTGKPQGIVPTGTLLQLVHDRYGEVLKRFTGIRENSEQAVSAIEGKPGRRVIHRIPWLLVGTFGSMIATLIMAGFEDILRSNVEVAFFIPGLVYLADAIGTQSEAIAVRGLSFSSTSIKRLWWGELQTGILLGLTLAVLIFPFLWLAFSASLALAVALALVFASSVATSIGLLFPWALTQLGKDPAYGSGPIATILQDLLSLVIYFLVVYWLVF